MCVFLVVAITEIVRLATALATVVVVMELVKPGTKILVAVGAVLRISPPGKFENRIEDRQ
jgi:hypothetical protein